MHVASIAKELFVKAMIGHIPRLFRVLSILVK